jgi:hypothetical protein
MDIEVIVGGVVATVGTVAVMLYKDRCRDKRDGQQSETSSESEPTD